MHMRVKRQPHKIVKRNQTILLILLKNSFCSHSVPSVCFNYLNIPRKGHLSSFEGPNKLLQELQRVQQMQTILCFTKTTAEYAQTTSTFWCWCETSLTLPIPNEKNRKQYLHATSRAHHLLHTELWKIWRISIQKICKIACLALTKRITNYYLRLYFVRLNCVLFVCFSIKKHLHGFEFCLLEYIL